MSLPKGFSESGLVGRGSFLSWTQVGDTFTGYVKQVRPPSREDSSWMASAYSDDGVEVRFTVPSILRELLEAVPEGARVHIVYSGTQKLSAKETLKEFCVYVANSAADSDQG